MAEYLVLIYEDEAAWDNPGPGTVDQMMKGHQVFGERNAAAIRGGQRPATDRDGHLSARRRRTESPW